jgi:hypothetical protein
MTQDEILTQFTAIQLKAAKLSLESVNYAIRNQLDHDDKLNFEKQLNQTIAILNVAKDCIWAAWE